MGGKGREKKGKPKKGKKLQNRDTETLLLFVSYKKLTRDKRKKDKQVGPCEVKPREGTREWKEAENNLH